MGGPFEKELLKALLTDYEIQNRPVLNESEPLVLTFGVTLQQIIDVVSRRCLITKFFLFLIFFYQDEKNQLLITCLWLNLVS